MVKKTKVTEIRDLEGEVVNVSQENFHDGKILTTIFLTQPKSLDNHVRLVSFPGPTGIRAGDYISASLLKVERAFEGGAYIGRSYQIVRLKSPIDRGIAETYRTIERVD